MGQEHLSIPFSILALFCSFQSFLVLFWSFAFSILLLPRSEISLFYIFITILETEKAQYTLRKMDFSD